MEAAAVDFRQRKARVTSLLLLLGRAFQDQVGQPDQSHNREHEYREVSDPNSNRPC